MRLYSGTTKSLIEDSTFNRILHNETAFLIQRRLQHAGIPMVVLPVRLTLKDRPRLTAPSLATSKERDLA